MNNKDIFDKIMSLKIFSLSYPFYKKNKEVLLYLFFGAVTTVVSILSFVAFEITGFDELIANIFSWILSVFVAFITNTIWVFDSSLNDHFIGKLFKFYLARFFTLLVEEFLLLVLVKLLLFNSLLIKCLAQFVVIILNYLISKLFVYKK